MSEFNLQKCIAGEAVETNLGQTAQFLAYDINLRLPLIMRILDSAHSYDKHGKWGGTTHTSHDLRMVDQKKKVDLRRLPVDTVCNVDGILKHFAEPSSHGVPLFFEEGKSSRTVKNKRSNGNTKAEISIAPNQPWTVWQGGECPIPDGLEFEVMLFDDVGIGNSVIAIGADDAYWGSETTIIAYRLTGNVLDGWTL